MTLLIWIFLVLHAPMARKKSKRGTAKRKPLVARLETRFDCPVCNHEKVVQCSISKAGGLGCAYCSACESQFKSPVTKLDRAIDVYHAWTDSVEEKAKET